MNKLYIILVLWIVSMSASAHEKPDIIMIDGHTYTTNYQMFKINDFLKRSHAVVDTPYHCIWSIRNDSLFLIDVEGLLINEKRTKLSKGMINIIKGKKERIPVFASWITDTLEILHGGQPKFPRLNQDSPEVYFHKEKYLVFSKGKMTFNMDYINEICNDIGFSGFDDSVVDLIISHLNENMKWGTIPVYDGVLEYNVLFEIAIDSTGKAMIALYNEAHLIAINHPAVPDQLIIKGELMPIINDMSWCIFSKHDAPKSIRYIMDMKFNTAEKRIYSIYKN